VLPRPVAHVDGAAADGASDCVQPASQPSQSGRWTAAQHVYSTKKRMATRVHQRVAMSVW
jgi:hypothetical protein